MKVLLASSEVHPYSKTGGLGDMVGALAKTLAQLGHQVGLVTPLYEGIRERFPEIKPFDWSFNLPLGGQRVQANVFTLEPTSGLTIYFIDQPKFYLRKTLYGYGATYNEDADRFIYFSKCVANLARYLPWQPEIVHVHDWHVGVVPLLIQHESNFGGWSNAPRTILTIHNLAYQGTFPVTKFPLLNLPWRYFAPDGVEFYGQLNCLKAGLFFAHAITAVSPRYAREITTPELGCGLDGLLRKRDGDLVGILNGVDYEEWNPATDPFLIQNYSTANLEARLANKIALQKELGLPVNEKIPLFGSINRLVDQKGVPIQLAALEKVLSHFPGTATVSAANFTLHNSPTGKSAVPGGTENHVPVGDLQFVQLGAGEPRYEAAYRELAKRFPEKVAVRIGYEQRLSHLIEAGCDFFILPSQFEPCGLNQMYSLRYGTVPIVRATGGLDDTVADITENVDRANGIKFKDYSAAALAKAIRKAFALYAEPELLRHYQHNGMSADFSWERTAQRYLDLYQGNR